VVLFKDKSSEAAGASARFLKWLGGITPESVIEVLGTPTPATVKSCSVTDLEVRPLQKTK